MLVVFGPHETDRAYIQNKILSNVSVEEAEGALYWDQGNRSCVMLGVRSFPDLVVSHKGWFLGYAYWDSLPDGYEKEGKSLLEISHELWKKEGTSFLKRLNGSFNLFLCDAVSGRSVLSTDRFGTYPLWMAELGGGGIAFSPDYNQLIPHVNTDVDPAGMWSFIARWRPVGNRTLLEKIKGVRQATSISFDQDDKPVTEEWYPQVFNPESDRHLNEWADEFNNCLIRSTQGQLSSFDSMGILLSGGVDSRLIASYCPKGTHCFTLADYENPELKTAEKIAHMCGHQHHRIIRDADWYADALAPASKQCVGLWRWSDAHFWKLQHYPGDWQQIQCAILGNWFDTFFKGAATPPDLRVNTPDLHDVNKAIAFCLEFDRRRCKFLSQIKEVVPSAIFEYCRQAHLKVLSDELERMIPNSFSILDAWDMTQFGSVYRSSAFPNIHCLRDFKPVRNIIFDNSFYDLYLKMPVSIRVRGEVVRRALWRRSKSLGFLSDSNSWLPATLPAGFHEASLKSRLAIAKGRNYINRKTGRNNPRSRGAWTKIAPLWTSNAIMIQTMNQILKDPNSLVENHFHMDSLCRIWKEHRDGTTDYSEILNAVAGLGLLGL